MFCVSKNCSRQVQLTQQYYMNFYISKFGVQHLHIFPDFRRCHHICLVILLLECTGTNLPVNRVQISIEQVDTNIRS